MARDDRIGGDTGHAAIDGVIRFIHANLAAPLDIENLAAVSGVSRSHFSRLFARTTGLPPAEFVSQQRMECAARLLANSQLSIKAISTRCGYSDPNHFSNVFRRFFQISPTDFRNSGMYAIANRSHNFDMTDD